MTPIVGQTWKMIHSRKGEFTGRLLSSPDEGDWLDVEIVAGKLRYASASNNFDQRQGNKGVPGCSERMRRSFVTFVQCID